MSALQLSPLELAANAPPPTIGAGTALGGKYTLLREAGIGGMGVVWVARNEATGGDVAVKFLLPRSEWNPMRVARMKCEARATASLSHRGIVRVFDLVEAPNGPLLLVLELLRGHTLAEHLAAEGRIAPPEAARIALDLLSALAHVHGSGIVHRDIKPSNVFLAMDPDGVVTTKLLDFGVSKMRFDVPDITAHGEVLGTPSYMSPEQAMGCRVDARSDIFAMGILLYEMLGGRNPFGGSGRGIAGTALGGGIPRLEHVPPRLWAVVARALRKNPELRFASAAEMATALRDAMIHRVQTTPRRRLRFAAALVAASLFVLTTFTLAGSPPAASSGARAHPRVKMPRAALTLSSIPSELSASVSSCAPPAAATPRVPPRARPDLAMDPGF